MFLCSCFCVFDCVLAHLCFCLCEFFIAQFVYLHICVFVYLCVSL